LHYWDILGIFSEGAATASPVLAAAATGFPSCGTCVWKVRGPGDAMELEPVAGDVVTWGWFVAVYYMI